MLNSRNIKAYSFGLLAILFWSTVASAFKMGLKYYTPAELLFIANSISLIVLFILAIILFPDQLKNGLQINQILRSTISGLINPFLYYLVLFKGYSLLPAQIAQPINYLWPVILSLLSIPFLKQKLDKQSVYALVLSFLGAFIVVMQGKIGFISVEHPVGILYCLLSIVLWSVFWIINLRDSRNAIVKLFYSFLFAQLYLTILFTVKGKFPPVFKFEVLYPVYIGLFEMSISFYLWMRALELTDRTVKLNTLIYLTPVISMVIIYFVLKEPLYYTTLIGLVLILSGVAIQIVKPRR